MNRPVARTVVTLDTSSQIAFGCVDAGGGENGGNYNVDQDAAKITMKPLFDYNKMAWGDMTEYSDKFVTVSRNNDNSQDTEAAVNSIIWMYINRQR